MRVRAAILSELRCYARFTRYARYARRYACEEVRCYTAGHARRGGARYGTNVVRDICGAMMAAREEGMLAVAGMRVERRARRAYARLLRSRATQQCSCYCGVICATGFAVKCLHAHDAAAHLLITREECVQNHYR